MFLHFLGWQSKEDKEKFHDSPEYFENLWIAGLNPEKCQYPVGLLNLYEAGSCGASERLRVVFDPTRTTSEKVVQDFKEAGLLVEPCYRRHSWSQYYLLLLAISALAFGIGWLISAPANQPHQQLGKISFATADTIHGIIRGTYEYKGHAITFEAVRGERNPMWDLTGPRFATDARLCDDHGFCFALQGGGSGIADPSWIKNRDEQIPNEPQARLNQETSWAFHRDIQGLDRSQFHALKEQLDALEGLANVPDPRTHELPATSPPPHI